MLKSNSIGYAIYPSNFEKLKDELSLILDQESFIFTSLHIQEEMNQPEYGAQVQNMLSYLQQNDIEIIADISLRTLDYFKVDSIEKLVNKLNLNAVRLDFGFSLDNIIEASKHVMIIINASMFDYYLLEKLKDSKYPVIAMHNFYPREHTGLDESQFIEKNDILRKYNIKIAAFIAGDKIKRGPIFAGLPTLEHQRNMLPYASYLQCKKKYDIDYVFVGDGVISLKEKHKIDIFNQENIILLRTSLSKQFNLINKVFTIRDDSPKDVLRLFESRTMATQGELIEPYNCIKRDIGSVCMDNRNYMRYSGEVQLLRKMLPQDHRVNVVGHIHEDDFDVLDVIKNNDKIKLVKDNDDED